MTALAHAFCGETRKKNKAVVAFVDFGLHAEVDYYDWHINFHYSTSIISSLKYNYNNNAVKIYNLKSFSTAKYKFIL